MTPKVHTSTHGFNFLASGKTSRSDSQGIEFTGHQTGKFTATGPSPEGITEPYSTASY